MLSNEKISYTEYTNINSRNMNILLLLKRSLIMLTFFSHNSKSTKCYTSMESKCINNEITKWNTKNVGKHIKEWIRSIEIDYYPESKPHNELHCKAFIMKEMPFFSQFDPDVISPYGVILGNTLPEDDENHEEQLKESKQNSPTVKLKFDGPVWADLNNEEWIIEEFENKMRARLSPDAILRNGLYYGVLNNDEMRIG